MAVKEKNSPWRFLDFFAFFHYIKQHESF